MALTSIPTVIVSNAVPSTLVDLKPLAHSGIDTPFLGYTTLEFDSSFDARRGISAAFA